MNSNVIDISKVRNGYRGYSSGNFRKASIVYQGAYYLLKYPERNKKKTHQAQVSSYMSNSISEYIGSHIFESVGIPVQQTLLGKTIPGSNAPETIIVACKDFVDREAGYELQEFVTLAKLFYSTSELGRNPSAEKVYSVIDEHYLLRDIKDEAIRRYWDTVVVDSMIGNFDRHAGNWGYITDIKTGETTLAPVYDCGSSLWAKTDDAAIPEILSSKERVEEFVFDFPKGQIRLSEGGEKYSYTELFSSGLNKDCDDAIERIYPRINIRDIQDLIKHTPFISDARARYLSVLIEERHHKILEPAYNKLHQKQTERPAEYIKAERSEPDIDFDSGAGEKDIDR